MEKIKREIISPATVGRLLDFTSRFSYTNGMAKISLPKSLSRIASLFASFFAFGGTAVAAYDFDAAWKEVDEACGKGLPRTVTNKVEEIQREAIKVKRWPDAARAFLVREEAMQESGRCLRCDHFGYGVFKGGRKDRW